MYVSQYPRAGTWEWVKVSWPTFYGMIVVFGLIIGSILEWITWMDQGFATLIFVGFLFFGLLWRVNVARWRKKKIIEWKQRNLVL